MADRLTLEIATPTRLVVAETADEVVIPGSQGYFGVLPGHAPFLTTLGIGELMYRVERRLSGRGDEEIDYARALAALARAVTRIITAGRTR